MTGPEHDPKMTIIEGVEPDEIRTKDLVYQWLYLVDGSFLEFW